MPQFFIESSKVDGKRCIIDGEDFRHLIKVRRVKPGDYIDLRMEDGTLNVAGIKEIHSSSIVAEIIDRKEIGDELIDLTICVGLLKGKQFDLVIKKAVEIGAGRIQPVITERTVPVVSRNERNKLERWRKIALEASKQSLRERVPIIEETASFMDVVSGAASSIKILAHTGEKSRNLREFLSGIEKKPDVSILIGPEGGFTEKEVGVAKEHGWEDLKFGYTCLRAETAAIVIPAILIYEWSINSEINS
ncbi:MAG: 16S rRNA (uracil(1498)-N(3))-methyltransferase [bacterium]|nr:16S rRNA (uracil(1498)-N(3))-methyltransferase [bacterium]